MASAARGRRWRPPGRAEAVWGANATTARLTEASPSALGVLVGRWGMRRGKDYLTSVPGFPQTLLFAVIYVSFA